MKNLIYIIAASATLVSFSNTTSFAQNVSDQARVGHNCQFLGIPYTCPKMQRRYQKYPEYRIDRVQPGEPNGSDYGGRGKGGNRSG